MIAEGEKGFWAYHAGFGRPVFVLLCFGFYTADQKETWAMCSSINHTGTAKKQCHRCAAEKSDLDNFDFPRETTVMTADRRLVIYNKINQIATSVTNVAELLRKGYGLSPKPCAFSFSKSLKVPENSIADLLHNIGINANAWILFIDIFFIK